MQGSVTKRGSTWSFVVDIGRAVHPESVTRHFIALRRELELPEIRLDDLRHTIATLALTAGVHPKVVSERLGHSTISMTLDLYSHVIPGLKTEAADKLGQIVFGDGGAADALG